MFLKKKTCSRGSEVLKFGEQETFIWYLEVSPPKQQRLERIWTAKAAVANAKADAKASREGSGASLLDIDETFETVKYFFIDWCSETLINNNCSSFLVDYNTSGVCYIILSQRLKC